MNLNEALEWADWASKDDVRHIEHLQSCAVTLAAEVRRLQAEVSALTTLCNDLDEYAQHLPDCNNGEWCDCGLRAVTKRLNERMGL